MPRASPLRHASLRPLARVGAGRTLSRCASWIHASAGKMRHTERSERATRIERRGRERVFENKPWDGPCEGERNGARPYSSATAIPEGMANIAVATRTAGWAESTCAVSAAHAPCVRWDGDPVVRVDEEWRRRLRGDKAVRRPMEEMRGFELVGTSSAAAPPGRIRALAHASIATGIAQT